MAAGYLTWESYRVLISELKAKRDWKILLFCALGGFFALRVNDILSLRWQDLVDNKGQVRGEVRVKEKKTGKKRTITTNRDSRELVKMCFDKMAPENKKNFIFLNGKGDKVISVQYLNRKLKKLAREFSLEVENFSTHSLRKTFGRKYWEENSQSEGSLRILQNVFNHSNIEITDAYMSLKL